MSRMDQASEADGTDEQVGKRVSKVDPYRHLLAEETDAEIARRANIHPETVRIYRKRHGIPPFKGEPSRQTASREPSAPVASTTAVEPPAKRPRGRPRKVRDPAADVAEIPAPRRRGRPRKVAATARPLPSDPATPEPTRLRKGGPSSVIDAYFDQLGHVPDGEIAMMSGVTRSAVYQYRRHRGIEMQLDAGGKVRLKPAKSVKRSPAVPALPAASEALVVPVLEPERPKTKMYVYIATVLRGDVERTYGVVGRDIVDATSRAAAAIHEDGGRLISVTEHLEALG